MMGYSMNDTLTKLRSSRSIVLVVVLVALFLDETLMTVVVPIIPDIFMKSYCSNSSLEGPTSPNGSHHLPQSGSSDVEGGSSDPIPISRLQEYSWYDEELAKKVFAQHSSWFEEDDDGGGGGEYKTTTTGLDGMETELVNPSLVKTGLTTAEEFEKCSEHVNIKTGLLLASKFMMRMVLSAPLGIFTEWIGYFIPLFVSTIILLASCLAYAFGHSFVVFLIARLLHGVAATALEIAGIGVVAYSYADDEEKRGFAIGLAISAFAFGSLAGPPFGSVLYSFFGQAMPFLILAIVALLLAVAEFLCISPQARNDSPDPAPVYVLLKDPLILAGAGAIGVAGAVIALLQSSLPLWLLKTTDAKDWQLGVIFSPSSIMQILSAVVLGFYGLRIGRWLCAMTALLLLGASIATVPLATHVVHLIPAMCVIGFSFGVIDSTMTASVNLVADVRYNGAYGAAAAISTFAFCLGFAIGPTLSGILVNTIGFPWTMRTMAILAAVYAPVCIPLRNVPSKDRLIGTERAVLLPDHQPETTAVELQHG